ncbi:MAG: hypothetical protein Q9213_006212 [Squamulea squamosa]
MPEHGIFDSLWADAVAEYEKQTDRKIDSDNAFRVFGSLRDLEDAIEKRKDHFDVFRSEHRKIYSALAKCIDPMEPLLQIVQKGIGNSPYAPACAVFGAASYLLQACTSVSKSYDGIEELFRQMSNITVRLKEYEYKNIESSLSKKMTDILACFLDIIGKAEAVIKRKRFKQWARTVFLKDDGISSAVARLQKYVEEELGLLIALTYGLAKDVQKTAIDTGADIKNVKADLNDLLTNQRSDRQRAFSEADEKKLSDALKTDTVEEVTREHVGNLEKLTKGTAAWIRDDVMFQAWEQEKAPCLWVFGKPGVGKTMLAARTIEILQNKYPQHSDIPSLTSVSYLYFKDDNPKLQDCAQMWKTAAMQITKANDRFKKHVLATIEKKQDTFVSARRIWQQLFLDFFHEEVSSHSFPSLAFIVIDGLDEAPQAERVKLLTCLAELVTRGPNQSKCRIQVAVFARPDVRADPGFETVSFRMQERLIEVTPERNNTDIDLYIKQRLGDVSVLQVLKKMKATKEFQTLAKQIYNSVQSKSQGMFLWARLVFDQIRVSSSPEAVRDSLQGAPKGLDDMLYHVFKRLEVDEQMHQSYLKELLTWVFCAYRPFYISELFVLITISAKQHCYMIEDDLRGRYSSLFDMTGPFVESEGDQEQVLINEEDKTASEESDFGFLDDDDSRHDKDLWDESDHSDDDDNENQMQTRDTAITGKGEVEKDTFNIPYHWHETTVTFSHARIRDYLKTEGDPSTRRWHDSSVVPDNLNTARHDIVLAFFQIIDTNITDTHGVYSLKSYANVNWIKHLVEIDFCRIPKAAAVQLARKLSTLFYGGQGLLRTSFEACNEFIKTWFSVSKFSTLVRKIIGDYVEDVDEDQRSWAISAAQSARKLFQPLMAACVRTWLNKKGWDDPNYLDKSERVVWIIYACSTLTDDGNNEGSVEIFNTENGFWNIALDDLESLANIEPVPKSAHFYAGLAWIMMEAEEDIYTDRAVEYFKKALELLPGGWVAMEGLARCYGDNRGEYDTAIHWMEDAIRSLPQTDGLSGIDFYLETRISDWKLQLGDDQESVEIAQISYEASKGFTYGTGTASDSSILRSIKHYIEALYRTGQYTRIVELLRDLDARETLELNTSLWTIFLQYQTDEYYAGDIFNKLGKMTQELQDDSLHEIMKASVKNVTYLNSNTIADYQPIWLADQLAEWQYYYAPDPQESVEIWEKIVTLVDQSNEVVQQSQNWFRSKAAGFLSMIFFNAAKSNFNAGKDASVHVAKIENLAQHKQGGKRYYRASYPALILGLWLHEYIKAGEEVWKACIRPSVKQAIYMLSDEDPWNDQDAYSQLGKALFAAGDILNGSIAYGVTMKPLEDHRKVLEQQEKEQGIYKIDVAVNEPTLIEAEAREQQGERHNEDTSDHQTRETDIPFGEDIGELEEAKDSHQNTYEKGIAQEERSTGGEHIGEPDNNEHKGTNTGFDDAIGDSKAEAEAEEEGDNNDDDDDAEEELTESVNIKYAGFVYRWTCDGPCKTSLSDYVELWFCRVCRDYCFCEGCIKLLRRDEIRSRICAADHPLVRAFPITKEADELANALVERRFEVQQKWLDALRRVWEE